MEFDLEMAWTFIERFGLPLALVVVIVKGLLVPRWAYDALEKRYLECSERADRALEAADRSTRTLEELVQLFKRRGE